MSLLTPDGLRYMFNSATKNFTGFAPLGTVLVAMLGVGVAEWTGLFNTSLKKLLMNANPKFLTPIVLLPGSCPTLPLMQVISSLFPLAP